MAEGAKEESWASGGLESKLKGPSHTGSKDVSMWTVFTLEFRLLFFPEAHKEGPKGKMGRIRVLHNLISFLFLLSAYWTGEEGKGKE